MEGMVGMADPCHMHPDTQPAPSPLTSDPPGTEGQMFCRHGVHCAAHPRSPSAWCQDTSLNFRQGTFHRPCCSTSPAHCSTGWVCPVEPLSFQGPTGPLWWEIWDLETRE